VDPEGHVDFMSYCNPVWVSDYTFRAIYDQMVAVEQETRPVEGAPAEPQAMRVYHVERDGSLRAGPRMHGRGRSVDDVVLEDASQRRLGSVRGSFQPLSNIGEGLLVTRDEIPPEMLQRTRLARPLVGR
jgi:hypothetical protein